MFGDKGEFEAWEAFTAAFIEQVPRAQEWAKILSSLSDAAILFVLTAYDRDLWSLARKGEHNALSASRIPDYLGLGHNTVGVTWRKLHQIPKTSRGPNRFLEAVMAEGTACEWRVARRMQIVLEMNQDCLVVTHCGIVRGAPPHDEATCTPDILVIDVRSRKITNHEIKTVISPSRFDAAPHSEHLVQVLAQNACLGDPCEGAFLHTYMQNDLDRPKQFRYERDYLLEDRVLHLAAKNLQLLLETKNEGHTTVPRLVSGAIRDSGRKLEKQLL